MQVMSYYDHKFTLDYCAHGGLFKKATTFWTTCNILRRKDNPNGFQPLLCEGWMKCGAMISSRKHYPFEAIKLVDRQAIPVQVSIGLGVAIGSLLEKVI
jgi:hypothetical protein